MCFQTIGQWLNLSLPMRRISGESIRNTVTTRKTKQKDNSKRIQPVPSRPNAKTSSKSSLKSSTATPTCKNQSTSRKNSLPNCAPIVHQATSTLLLSSSQRGRLPLGSELTPTSTLRTCTRSAGGNALTATSSARQSLTS